MQGQPVLGKHAYLSAYMRETDDGDLGAVMTGILNGLPACRHSRSFTLFPKIYSLVTMSIT